MSNAISSSPTKVDAPSLPVPSSGPSTARRGHAHRRSTAVSVHEVGDITKPREAEPRLSSSLPATPLEHPAHASPPLERPAASEFSMESTIADAFGSPLEDGGARPPSRRTVGFSDTVQYIPRPLSTISSETEGSVTPTHGHSLNNSISSVLSMSAPSPPAARQQRSALSTTFEDEPQPKVRSSIEVSKRVEKEGEWLRSSSSSQNLQRPMSESAAASTLSFAVPDAPAKSRNVHGKKHSLSHALGLDRRRSEPVISLKAEDQARLTATAIQLRARDGEPEQSCSLDRKKSSRRIRDWAASKIGRRSKDGKRGSLEDIGSAVRRPSAAEVPGKVPFAAPAAAETDLDAVFNNPLSPGTAPGSASQRPRIEVSTPSSFASTFQSQDTDDLNPMLDLDAALGPFNTPGSKAKRELHSSRLTKDFVGPGMHYHRRTESAPALAPSGIPRTSMASTKDSLPDVFENEGEGEEEATHEESLHSVSPRLAPVDEAGVGIQVVDTAHVSPGTAFSWGPELGLGIQRDDWEMERLGASYESSSSRLSTPMLEHRRASSVVEATIPEEMSPVDQVEIVEAHEEPRASSLTKSSESSDTPTILASPTPGALSVPEPAQSLTSPEAHHTSDFSSPDLSRRQGSSDTSRLGTSICSTAENRTMSSCAGEPMHGARHSSDDVPSLTSSRSTMLSTMHANTSRRDFGSADRTSSLASNTLESVIPAERRRKRASIQSLSQLVGGSFQGKSRDVDEARPQTAIEPGESKAPKKEHRLKKLMFWRSKSKQNLHSP